MARLIRHPDETPPHQLVGIQLYAWVGPDEFGSDAWGLKQGVVPAGTIPLVATSQAKLDQDYIMNGQIELAKHFGLPRYLARYTYNGLIYIIEP